MTPKPTFAVLQRDLEPPSVEALQRAFRGLPRLTPVDAFAIARDAFGILLQRLSGDEAAAVSGALRREGVETEIVPEREVPAMPPGKNIRRLQFKQDHFLVYDPLGRPIPIPWAQAILVAAGDFEVSAPVAGRFPARSENAWTAQRPRIGSRFPDPPRPMRSPPDPTRQRVLDLVVGQASMRFSLEADRCDYRALEDLVESGTAMDPFARLIQEVLRHTPRALLNRGAFLARENAPEPFQYPSRHAYEEEMRWLLWRWRKASARQAEGS